MKKIFYCFTIISALFFTGCTGKTDPAGTSGADPAGTKLSVSSEAPQEKTGIAVFVPGVTAGSPTYEMLVAGVQKAADEKKGTETLVFEAGFNQGEWENKLTALAGTKNYKYIITSNPAMPEICSRVSKIYPDQKFIILDGYLEGNENIYTFLFNSHEQAYLIGVMGALVTGSDMPGADKNLKVGLIAGQEYPMMNNVIKPGFEKGLKSVNREVQLDFRIVGNWYDASKGAELAGQMYSSGIDVILAIAGGAGQGVLSTAKEKGKYVLWFDNNGYSLSDGQVAGCSAVRLDKAAYEITKKAVSGTLPFGTAEIAGVKEGYVYFIDDDPAFIKIVPEELREKIKDAQEMISSGAVKLEMPHF
ncbi:MAG: BMP family ABC transporter substrate-binding protein [Spirochaetia bacterium]|jgi:simple sugar transport system substrate-binding protein|nr:BMP family ABC transporter substrate-binding protein [Spirochaetia bacterium]